MRRLLHKQSPDSYLSDFDYTVEPYAGCNFGCRYCFVPERSKDETRHPVNRWGFWREQSQLSDIEAELARPSVELAGAWLCLAGATDAWQPAERKYGLTRRVLEILSTSGVAFLLASTRSPGILRDIDLLRRFEKRLLVAISIGSDLESVGRAVEPRAPRFQDRLATIQALCQAGINVRISVAPVLAHSQNFFACLMKLGIVLWLDVPDPRTPATGHAHMTSAGDVLQLTRRLQEQYGPERITFGRQEFAGQRRAGGRA
jgi:DNA repair photolyase